MFLNHKIKFYNIQIFRIIYFFQKYYILTLNIINYLVN